MKEKLEFLGSKRANMPLFEQLHGLFETMKSNQTDLLNPRLPILAGKNAYFHIKGKNPEIPVVLKDYLPDNLLVTDDKLYVFNDKKV